MTNIKKMVGKKGTKTVKMLKKIQKEKNIVATI
jgi:hypothetical protein